MFGWVPAVAKVFVAMFSFAKALIKPDSVRIDDAERAKPRKDSREIIRIYDREYMRLKWHTEIDIASDVNLVNDELPEDQKRELIANLTDRIFQFRGKNPVLFKKFLETKMYQDWLKKQNKR